MNIPINLKNTSLLLISLLVLLFSAYLPQTLVGFVIGVVSLYLFMQVREYGLRRTFMIDKSLTNSLFQHIKEGNLEEIKAIRKKFPTD